MASPPTVPSRAPVRIPATVFLHEKRLLDLKEVGQLHAQLVVYGLADRRSTAGKLVDSYASISCINQACLAFNEIHYPDVFAYNTIIRGLTLANSPYNALLLYKKLLSNHLIPDNYTYTFILKACSHINAISEGKQVHCQITKMGIPPDTHIHSSLIHMYTNSNSIACAERVLGLFSQENTLSNNSMISGYLRQGYVQKAKELFEGMMVKDAASWSAMVSGYTNNGLHAKALIVFREMIGSRVAPNESVLVGALSACAQLGALDQGRWIHAYVDRIGAEISLTLGTALVHMYGKCGSICCGYQVFKRMPRRDVIAWGVMISGFAMHGQAQKCFELFDEMLAAGIRPNSVIFVAVLSACSHVGYVKVGYRYFNQMVPDFGIKPSIEHYGCMVDLLARAGRLAEAEEFIESIPEEPNAVIWGAMLAACRTRKDSRRGERAFRQLIELEPTSGDRYKLAGHMFAAAGEKDNVIRIRKLIKEKELETSFGASFIEVDGKVHEFVVGDTGNVRAGEMYRMLEEIKKRLNVAGFEARKKYC